MSKTIKSPFLRLVPSTPGVLAPSDESDADLWDVAEAVPEIPVITVNPGQRITVISRIAASQVGFSYLAPGADERVVDPGLGQPGSKLKRVDAYTVKAAIDTRGMEPGGEGWWLLTGEDEEDPELQVSEPGRFVIRKVPHALLGMAPVKQPKAQKFASRSSGLDMLGAVSDGSSKSSWLLAVGGTLFGVLFGFALARS